MNLESKIHSKVREKMVRVYNKAWTRAVEETSPEVFNQVYENLVGILKVKIDEQVNAKIYSCLHKKYHEQK